MFLSELEELGRVPVGGVLCLLCSNKILISHGDIGGLRDHLNESHSVCNNIDWIINCTLRSQNRTGREPAREIQIDKINLFQAY